MLGTSKSPSVASHNKESSQTKVQGKQLKCRWASGAEVVDGDKRYGNGEPLVRSYLVKPRNLTSLLAFFFCAAVVLQQICAP